MASSSAARKAWPMRRADMRGAKRACAAGFWLALGAAVFAAMAASPQVALPESGATRSREVQLRQMDPAQRARLQRQVMDWDALPLEQRLERRARYAAWRALTPSERAQLRAIAAQVAGFEPDREQALRSQFEALDSIQQRAWRLGPHLGGVYQALQPLLAYAPPEQGDALLLMLRSMPAAERDDLAVLVQRVPPQERQALREQMLGLAPAQRGPWLKRRLAK